MSNAVSQHQKQIDELTELYNSQRRRTVDYDCACRFKNNGWLIRMDSHICHAHWTYMRDKTYGDVDKWLRNQSND